MSHASRPLRQTVGKHMPFAPQAHALNAPSPAATASLEIGRFIADLVDSRS